MKPLKDRLIIIKGAGEMATGVACSLYRANFRRILMLETEAPLAVRRQVSFCEAVYEQEKSVEGIAAIQIDRAEELQRAWQVGKIAVKVDPGGKSIPCMKPDVLVDATLAKRNLGTSMTDAPLVIALGPGFTAGMDCHMVVETNRGHDLGRVIVSGAAEANTGVPGEIGGYSRERVIRSPIEGLLTAVKKIGDYVEKGEAVCKVGAVEVSSEIDGVLRGLIRPGSWVSRGLKIGDVDPRGKEHYCDTVSEKARSMGGAVLEALLTVLNV